MAEKVSFITKRGWQKGNCINCSNLATLEAVLGVMSVRCCSREACKKRAEELAKVPTQGRKISSDRLGRSGFWHSDLQS